jgi:hypothetical protein
MGEMRFARQRRGGSSREKGNKVLRSCKYNKRGRCVCSGASRRGYVEGEGRKEVASIFVADAIGRLAIQLARSSREIFLLVFGRARDVQKRRQWRRADGGCSSLTQSVGTLQRWRCSGCARRAFRGVLVWDQR